MKRLRLGSGEAAVAQLVEHLVVTQVVPGSSPGGGVDSVLRPVGLRPMSGERSGPSREKRRRYALAGQRRHPAEFCPPIRYGQSRARISAWLERSAHNRLVLGSNPSGPISRGSTVNVGDRKPRSERRTGGVFLGFAEERGGNMQGTDRQKASLRSLTVLNICFRKALVFRSRCR